MLFTRENIENNIDMNVNKIQIDIEVVIRDFKEIRNNLLLWIKRIIVKTKEDHIFIVNKNSKDYLMCNLNIEVRNIKI